MSKHVLAFALMLCACGADLGGGNGPAPIAYEPSGPPIDEGIYQPVSVLSVQENCRLGLTAASVMSDYEVMKHADESNSLYSLATVPKTDLGSFRVGTLGHATLTNSSILNDSGCDFLQQTTISIVVDVRIRFTMSVTQVRSTFRQDGSSSVCKPPAGNSCTVSYALSLQKR